MHILTIIKAKVQNTGLYITIIPSFQEPGFIFVRVVSPLILLFFAKPVIFKQRKKYILMGTYEIHKNFGGYIRDCKRPDRVRDRLILSVKTDYFVEINEKITIGELINHKLFIKHLKIIEII